MSKAIKRIERRLQRVEQSQDEMLHLFGRGVEAYEMQAAVLAHMAELTEQRTALIEMWTEDRKRLFDGLSEHLREAHGQPARWGG